MNSKPVENERIGIFSKDFIYKSFSKEFYAQDFDTSPTSQTAQKQQLAFGHWSVILHINFL